MNKYLLLLLAITVSAPVLAWEGEDEDGNSVVIEKGNLVRSGREIEYERDGETVTATVNSIRSMGYYVEIEVTDEDGDEHTLEMERR